MEVLKVNIGMSEKKIDAHGIRFFGNIDGKAKHQTGISELIQDPDVSPMIKHKRVTLWYMFENIRPYIEVSDMINDISVRLRQREYTIIPSSLDDLVDTTADEYKGRPESKFPVPYKKRGYNAARGFSVTAEKIDGKQKFSLSEIETIKELSVKIGHMIYGRNLDKVEIEALGPTA
ncbi:MAG: hypothetical protein ABFD82_16375 [Syntrophaceae bacterium]